MIKKILVTVIGFVLGLGVTTYVMVKNHKNAPPALTQQTADTTKVATDTSVKHAAAATTDSTRPKPDSTAPSVTATPATTPTVTQPPIVPGPTTPTGVAVAVHSASAADDPVQKAQAYKSVARIFASMKPAEAAQVLALLSDTEVEGILRAVGPKQAADFLINLPKERAAALSRRLLVPKPLPDSGTGK